MAAAASTEETISGNVTWENRNIATPVTVKGDTTITLKGENSIYQPATETTDKYDIDDDGTKDTVYEISNAGQLYWFAGLDAQQKNIDMSNAMSGFNYKPQTAYNKPLNTSAPARPQQPAPSSSYRRPLESNVKNEELSIPTFLQRKK